MHDSLRLVGSGVEDTALVPQDVVEMGRSTRLVVDPGDVRGVRRLAPHTMVLLGGNWQTKERAFRLWEGIEVLCSRNGFVPEQLGQAVHL